MAPPAPVSLESQAMNLATQRWQRIFAGEIDASFEFLSPASRKAIPITMYRNHFARTMVVSAEPVRAKCDAEVCEVVLEIGYRFPKVAGDTLQKTGLTEKWLIDNGRLWYVFAP